jgi:hypothetical protein
MFSLLSGTMNRLARLVPRSKDSQSHAATLLNLALCEFRKKGTAARPFSGRGSRRHHIRFAYPPRLRRNRCAALSSTSGPTPHRPPYRVCLSHSPIEPSILLVHFMRKSTNRNFIQLSHLRNVTVTTAVLHLTPREAPWDEKRVERRRSYIRCSRPSKDAHEGHFAFNAVLYGRRKHLRHDDDCKMMHMPPRIKQRKRNRKSYQENGLKVIRYPHSEIIFALLAERNINRLTNHRADNKADEETRNTIPK